MMFLLDYASWYNAYLHPCIERTGIGERRKRGIFKCNLLVYLLNGGKIF